MKISFIEPHLKIFGGIRRILELSNRLGELGHDVVIYHSDGSVCQWMETTAVIRSYKDVLRQQHEVLIFNDPNIIDFQPARQAVAQLKVFYVLELYDIDLLRGFNLRLFQRKHRRTLYVKAFLQSSYLKLSNATWLVEWLKNNLNIDSKLLLGGVNQEMFHPVQVERKPQEIRLLCSGDPQPRKGTKAVLEAVRIARRHEPRLVLDTYHGQEIPQELMAVKYSSADIFVDGQYQAGWSNPVAEALGRCSKSGDPKLFCIDTWKNDAMSEGPRDTFHSFQENTRSWSNIIVPIVGYTEKVEIPFDGFCDIVFIDADHSYEGCSRDVKRFAPLVRNGGRLIFDDQISYPGVRIVVGELLESGDWYVAGTCNNVISLCRADQN